MSILIKGMKMPKNCSLCQFCFGANNICPWVRQYATCKGRHKDCPLIEVPPHGRLIDADELGLTDFEIVMCNGDYKKGLEMLAKKIENAPTVISADKDGET